MVFSPKKPKIVTIPAATAMVTVYRSSGLLRPAYRRAAFLERPEEACFSLGGMV
jgi:hypothetical protein